MALASPIRKTSVQLTIAGADATSALSPYIEEFIHSDSMDMDCNADTITIKLANPDFRFLRGWNVDKGSTISASILTYNWAGLGEGLQLQCGTFYVDEIEFNGPPNTCTIKATSIPTLGQFKGVKSNAAFENLSLKDIITKLASPIPVNYKPAFNPMIDRLDSDEESNGFAIKRICDRNGLSVKMQDGTLIVTDESELDQQAPFFTFTLGVTPIIRYQLETSNQHTVGGQTSAYMDPVTGQKQNDQWIVPDPPEGRDAIDLDNDRPDPDDQLS